MKKNIISGFIVALLLLIHTGMEAQSLYWVYFSDKDDVSFDPVSYFDPGTIERRIEKGIPLVQFSDLPVREDYIESVNNIAVVRTVSRWMNAVSVKLSKEDIAVLESKEFVTEIRPLSMTGLVAGRKEMVVDPADLNVLKNQVETMGGELFRKNNINGKGVRIAIFDIGFTSVDTLEIFSHLRDEGRIVATWDFVEKNEYVYHYNTHGTTVLGCIAGILDSLEFGLGTGAEFLLARTEVRSEIFEEEEYWAAAMEWADKNGADIISSSLGYTSDRYFPKQMDGKSVFVTRVANKAASKGILVINAAGNDGDDDWQVINAPADADSVLTIGGISPWNGIHISFSSYGPTADGRMKPNLSSFGQVVSAGKSSVKKAFGTSFSTPLVTGFAACVMELHPDWDNMKVFNELEKSGHLYPYYDYAHGYGVPQASYFFDGKYCPGKTFEFNKHVNVLEIRLLIANNSSNVLSADEKVSRMSLDDDYLYYHIADSESGKIRKYAVVHMTEDDKFNISLSELKPGELVRASYQGYTSEYLYKKQDF